MTVSCDLTEHRFRRLTRGANQILLDQLFLQFVQWHVFDMAMNVFGTRDPFTKIRDSHCEFGSTFGLGLFGGIRFRTKMNTLGVCLFLEFHSHILLLFMVTTLCCRTIDCHSGCGRRSRRSGCGGRSKRRSKRRSRRRRRSRSRSHRSCRSSMFLNNERGLLCHREIFFWQGKIAVLFSLTTSSSYSYGLSRVFRNSKCSGITHPILERDQKEAERDIRCGGIQVS